MKVTHARVWRVSPPHDTWLLAELGTDAGITGWGELTGSGNDAAVTAMFGQTVETLIGCDPQDIARHLAGFYEFRFPPLSGKLAATAWSGLAQTLWDISAQAHKLPLYALFGGHCPDAVPLYANLNRGLLRDRSPEAHARHVEAALQAGFSAVKCTPFDEITPQAVHPTWLISGMERVRAAVAVAGTDVVALDCHQRFALPLARHLLEHLAELGTFYWVEDVLAAHQAGDSTHLRMTNPGIVLAGGEELYDVADALRFVTDPQRPEVYMPDIKYLCGLDRAFTVCRAAEAFGCRIAPHNPSGPISQAFSAHLATAFTDAIVEYPFMAVPDRISMTTPHEPVEHGMYHITDRPGIGLAPSKSMLEQYGALMFAV